MTTSSSDSVRAQSRQALPPSKGERYETLDALRGVAAVAVVAMHVQIIFGHIGLFSMGFLSVDFFFVLSGFVVAHAYSDRLGAGHWFWTFLRIRIIRLYPLALLGALFGAFAVFVKWRLTGGSPQMILGTALNLFMLPNPFSSPEHGSLLFPGNNPLWSLFFEFWINIVWAAFCFRFKTPLLACVVVLSGLGLAVNAINGGPTGGGFSLETFWVGLGRVTFGFGLGLLLQRTSVTIPSLKFGPLALSIILLLVLQGPEIVLGTPVVLVVWVLASIFAILPLIVVLGVNSRPTGPIGRLLGQISYPLYALHWPILTAMANLHKGRLGFIPVPLYACLSLLLSLAVSYVVSEAYDKPVRTWLTKLSRGRVPISGSLISAENKITLTEGS